MKLNILSDLHLGFGAMDRPVNDADVVVLAGDIARPREAVAWALRFDKPVLYVPGNHEFYGSSIDGALDELQRLCTGTQVQVLDQRETVLGGVRFLGATLWTDFELFDDPPQRAAAKAEAQRLMRDFSRIECANLRPTSSRRMTRCISSGATRPGWRAAWPRSMTGPRW
jgi:predicted phosphohydrolase